MHAAGGHRRADVPHARQGPEVGDEAAGDMRGVKARERVVHREERAGRRQQAGREFVPPLQALAHQEEHGARDADEERGARPLAAGARAPDEGRGYEQDQGAAQAAPDVEHPDVGRLFLKIEFNGGYLAQVGRKLRKVVELGLADLRVAFDMVSAAPAAILGLGESWGIRPGARADLLIADAEDVDDLVATGATNRAVLVGGRLVAGTL